MEEPTEVKRRPIDVDRRDVVNLRHSPYLLPYYEFIQLTKLHSFVAIWAHTFFAGTGVFLVTIIAKWIDINHFNGKPSIDKTEWITLCLLIFLVIVFEFANWRIPSERKKTAKKIQRHFDRHEN